MWHDLQALLAFSFLFPFVQFLMLRSSHHFAIQMTGNICLFHAYKRFTLKFLVSKENGRTDKRISKNQCTVYDSALSLLQNALQVKVKVTPVRFVRLCCSKTAIPLHTAVPQTKPITSSVKNVYSAHTRNTYVTLQNT